MWEWGGGAGGKNEREGKKGKTQGKKESSGTRGGGPGPAEVGGPSLTLGFWFE